MKGTRRNIAKKMDSRKKKETTAQHIKLHIHLDEKDGDNSSKDYLKHENKAVPNRMEDATKKNGFK